MNRLNAMDIQDVEWTKNVGQFQKNGRWEGGAVSL